MKPKITRQQAINELWHRGVLQWILYKHQLPIYDKIKEVINSTSTTENSYVIDCSRQFGKSFIMFLVAVEECLQKPNYTVAFIGPLKSQVNEIINGHTFGVIFKTAPTNLTPKFDGSTLTFTNGSRIRLAGTDNRNYLNLRGGAANLILLDEAGFMAELDIGVMPVVQPMTKTTNGKIIFASTPPETLEHPYIDILREHTENNLISTYTIWDDKSITPEQLEKIINQCHGKDTTLFKREYECQRISELSLQVIPELQYNWENFITESEHTDPMYHLWQRYVVADTGVKDKTVVLFAYYNYNTKKLVIEDYLDLQGSQYNTQKLAKEIAQKTANLWPKLTSSIRYVADSNNLIVIQDLNVIYNLPFVATTKGFLDEMVQQVRNWVYDERLQFTPNAEEMLHCARYAVWSKSRKEFARSTRFSHYDGLAALTYLIRNVDQYHDPIPRDFGMTDKFTQFMMPENYHEMKIQQRQLFEIFGNKRKGSSFL